MIDGTKKNAVFVSALGVLLALLMSCGQRKDASKKSKEDQQQTGDTKLPDGLTPEQAAKVVATVGERKITVGEVTRQINRLSPYIRRRWAAPEKRKEFLDNLIRVELLSQEAERLGLADDAPEIQQTVKQVMIRLMIKNDFDKEFTVTSIDPKILKETYDKEAEKYHRPAQVRASQIVLKTRAEAEKLLGELKTDGVKNALFRQKARELSIDEGTKSRGGDLGYFSKPDERRDDEPEVPRAVAEAAWSLTEKGEIYGTPVETAQEFHIVKLTNRRPEMNRSFESVKRIIENRLIREKRKEAMDKFITDLRSRAKIEIYEENLKKIELAQQSPKAQGSIAPPKGAGPPTGVSDQKKSPPRPNSAENDRAGANQ